MSSFGTGNLDLTGTLTSISAFTGTNGAQAGSDGLVPGPGVNQAGYLLGAGGDWTLEVLGGIALNDSSDRIATTQFVQQVIGNAQLGGNANLGALGDVNLAGLADDQFLQYDLGALEWKPVTLNLGSISDVNLLGLQAGNTIVWDAVNSQWIPGQGGGGGAANLTDLGDVTINGGADKHFLVRNAQGQYVNRLISTADLSDVANIALLNAVQTFSGDVTFTADVDLTGAVTDVVTQGAGNNTTLAASTAFVQQEINALGLGTASQSAVGDFLASGASIADLSDVHTLQGIQVGNVLAWTANNRFEFTAPAVTYTDEEARNASGTALAGGNHTGISFANNNPANTIDATVSLAGFSVGALSDVDTTTNAPVLGEVLKWDGAKFVPASDTAKTQEEIEDIVGDMVAGNTETGISVTYAGNGAGAGKLNFVVDSTVVGFLGGAQTFTGNKTFTGAVDLTGSTATASLQGAGTNNTSLATTSFVQQEITALGLGTASQSAVGDFLASNSGTDDLTDVVIAGQQGVVLADRQTLVYDNANSVFRNAKLASGDLSDTANIALLNANQSFTGSVNFTTQAAADNSTLAATTAFVQQEINALGLGTASTNDTGDFLASNSGTDDLSDVAIAGQGGVVLADRQTLVYDNANSVFRNAKLASGDLSDTANIALLNANQTFTGSVQATTQANNDNSTLIATTAFVKNVMAAVGNVSDLDDLTDVTLAGQGGVVLADRQTLVYDNANSVFRNEKLASGDLSDTANIALLSANQTFTGGVNFTTQAAADNSTLAATTAFVQQEITALGLGTASTNDTGDFLASNSGTDDLTDVTIAGQGGVVLADRQTLVYDNANSVFRNAKLASGDLSDTANIALLNANQTFTGNVNFVTQAAANNTTLAATTAFVQQEITALNLGTASTNDTGDFLASNTVLNDLVAGGGDAHILVYDNVNNNSWRSVAISGDIGISNAGVVSITGGAIVDADINAAANIAVTKLASSSITVGTTSITLGDSSSTLSGMTGIDFTNQDATIGANMTSTNGGANPTVLTLGGAGSQVSVTGNLSVGGTLTVTGTVTTTNTNNLDISDQIISLNNGVANANTTDIGFFFDRGTSDPALIFWDEGDGSFKVATHTGVVDSAETDFSSVAGLTLAELQVKAPALADNSNLVPTTSWVQTEIGNLAIVSDLDDLTDVTIGGQGGAVLADRQTLVYDNANSVFRNEKLASGDLSDTANIALLNANQSFTGSVNFTTQAAANNTTLAATTAFVQQEITALNLGTASTNDTGDFLASNSGTDDLSDVAIAGQGGVVLADRQTLVYDNANSVFRNAKLASADLSDTANIALLGANQSFTGNVNFVTQAAANNTTLAATTAFVQQEITALGLGTASTNDTGDFLASNSGTDDLSDVVIAGQGGAVLADRQTLVYDNANSVFRNAKLASGDLSDTANIALLSANQTFTGGVNFTTQAAANNTTLAATTAFVQQEITALGLGTASTNDTGDFLASNSGTDDLSDVTIAGQGGVVLADRQTLVYDNANSVFRNAKLASGDLSDGANIALLGANQTFTGNVNFATQAAANNTTLAATTAFVQQEITALNLGTASTVDTTVNGGVNDAGKALVADAQGKLGAIDGSNLTALGSIGLHSNVDLTNLAHGQGLVYSTTNGVNRFEPGTVPTTGTNVDQSPTITAQSISLNPDALVGGDLVIYGRVMEVIDYGSVADNFGAGDFAIDFGSVTDTVLYCVEDYGVLVV